MILTISVSEVHIANGKFEDMTSCPIALAVNSILVTDVSVCDDRISFRDHTRNPIKSGRYFPESESRFKCVRKLSKTAKMFIQRFDKGLLVKPFKFKLNIPKKYLKSK